LLFAASHFSSLFLDKEYTMEYALIWHYHHGSEEIDCFDDAEEAKRMRVEYEMAYGGTVTIKRRRS
jgi:hypothetical protein